MGGAKPLLRERQNISVIMYSRKASAAYAPVWQHSGLIGEARERTERALEKLTPDLELSAPLRMQLYLEHAFALHITMGSIEKTKTTRRQRSLWRRAWVTRRTPPRPMGVHCRELSILA